MKYMIAVIALALCCLCPSKAEDDAFRYPPQMPTVVTRWTWNGYTHTIFQVGGHWYLEVTRGDAVCVIHYESCPCKRRH